VKRKQIVFLLITAIPMGLFYFAGRHVGSRAVSPAEIVRRYHVLAYANPGTWNLRWLGIPTEQNPNDVWIIQEIIYEVKPDFIVETGTSRGGSAAIWAMIQREVNPAGRVITVDIKDSVDPAVFPGSLRERVDFTIGNSVAPEMVSRIRERVRGKRVIVLLDSDHHRPHVLKELEAYSPLVSGGSYLIVQDTNINGNPVTQVSYPEYGPMEAVQEFLARNPQFQSDASREKLLFTMHPKGFLKRVSGDNN
jgi:cephalosporin hydroxylase